MRWKLVGWRDGVWSFSVVDALDVGDDLDVGDVHFVLVLFPLGAGGVHDVAPMYYHWLVGRESFVGDDKWLPMLRRVGVVSINLRRPLLNGRSDIIGQPKALVIQGSFWEEN